jgi:hypothetical protein
LKEQVPCHLQALCYQLIYESIAELYGKEKHWKSLGMMPNHGNLPAKRGISHLLKLINLVFPTESPERNAHAPNAFFHLLLYEAERHFEQRR